MRFVRLFAPLYLALCCLLAASGDLSTFRIEFTCGHCSSFSNMVVELSDIASRQVASTTLGQNGVAELYGVRAGSYTMTLRAGDGTAIHITQIQTGTFGAPLTIQIPDDKRVNRPVSGTISVARLKHKVPKKARKEYDRSVDKMENGDLRGSLEHLKKAVEIDPEYMEALNNLGSRYLVLGDARSAFQSFRRAQEIDPGSALVQSNIAIALMSLHDVPGAEAAARRAIEMDPADVKAKYMLGLALYAQKKFTPETVTLLTNAQENFPNASVALATVHALTGHEDLARKSLKAYLQSGQKEQRKKVEAMLASLQ